MGTIGKPLPRHPSLDRLVKDAMARFYALPPEQRAAHRRTQRRSWVIGEMLLEHPEMGHEYAERLYDKLEG